MKTCKFIDCSREFIEKRSSHTFCSDIRREKYRLSGRTKKHYEKSRSLYPEKRIAGYMAYSNFKNAKICSIERCQEEGQRHHSDYSKPLDIVWLCREHHTEEHNKIRRLSSQGSLLKAH